MAYQTLTVFIHGRTKLRPWFIFVLFLATLTSVQMQSSSGNQQQDIENVDNSQSRRLLDELFNKRKPTYSRSIRPVKGGSTQVNITIQIVLTDIVTVDEKEHKVEMNTWWRGSWRDEFLTWNPKDFGGMKSIIIPAIKIWLPADVKMYNSLATYEAFTDPGNAKLSSDGTIFWSTKVLSIFYCAMFFTNFPFDEQKCYLRVGSWSHFGSLIDMNFNTEAPLDIYSQYHENGEWDLLDAGAYKVKNQYEIFANASDPSATVYETWPELYFTMSLRRKYEFHLITLLLPYYLISALSCLVFVIQPDAGEKMGLSTTVLLALVVFNEYVTNIVPPNADTLPLLANYFVIMIFWVSTSVLMTAWVLHLYHQDPKTCKRMGPKMRFLVFGFMARVIRESNHGNPQGNDKTIENMGNTMNMETKESNDVDQGSPYQVTTSGKHGNARLDSDVGRIRQLLEGGKEEKEVDNMFQDAEEAPLQEWREAVRIIDKFFFWVYTIINAFLMIVFLFVSIYYSL